MKQRNEPTEPLRFEASAYLQTLIGRELFRSQDFALVELVKNAYDAKAAQVTISIQPSGHRAPGAITVTDNGEGMALEAFERLFMVAGYSERPGQVGRAKRVPTGEKGIGRFATDRLGSRLRVITKTKDDTLPLTAEIDWTDFQDRKKRFSDIELTWKREPVPELGIAKSGTILQISALREAWNTTQIRALRAELSKLLNPLDPPRNFEITLNAAGSPSLSGTVVAHKPADADFEVAFTVLDDGKIQRQLKSAGKQNAAERVTATAPHSAKLAGLQGAFLYFLKRPARGRVGDLGAGVRVYRDGFRIEPFGSETADWLGIAEKRAKRAGHAHVVPSRLFGYVSISRKKHRGLQDTTGREALLDNDAARALVTVLREQLGFLDDSIRMGVAEPRWHQARAEKASQLERERLHSLSIVADGLAHELRQPLQAIRTEADNIKVRLGQLGITDADVSAAQTAIDESIDRIDRNIRSISRLSSGDLQEVVEVNLAEVVRNECGLLENRCRERGIALEVEAPPDQRAHVNETTVAMIVMNLVRNSMDALAELTQKADRRITVQLRRAGGRHELNVTDNGPGIPADIRPKIFKRFASKKTGGIGIGLHNCHIFARGHGGDLTFQSREGVGTTFTLQLPDEGE